MSHSWNRWACIVDDEMEKNNKDLEKRYKRKMDLQERVLCAEDVHESLIAEVESLCEKRKMDEQMELLERKRLKVKHESSCAALSKMSFVAGSFCDVGDGSSKACETIAEVYEGFVERKPLASACPDYEWTTGVEALWYPEPPTRVHARIWQMRSSKGWHTDCFNEWLLPSQSKSGTLFHTKDSNGAIFRYVQRLQTFTLPVGRQYNSKGKLWETVLQTAIPARVDAGAGFLIVKSKPSAACSGTLIGCTTCGASLNLKHAYFGQGGVYDPDLIEVLDCHTTNFWFTREEQKELGLLPGDRGKARMCPAETLKPGCRIMSIDDV